MKPNIISIADQLTATIRSKFEERGYDIDISIPFNIELSKLPDKIIEQLLCGSENSENSGFMGFDLTAKRQIDDWLVREVVEESIEEILGTTDYKKWMKWDNEEKEWNPWEDNEGLNPDW